MAKIGRYIIVECKVHLPCYCKSGRFHVEDVGK